MIPRFADLLEPDFSTPPGVQQEMARQRFGPLASLHGLEYWRPGLALPVAGSGPWLLIGVAAGWALPDLRMLDALVASRSGQALIRERRVAVFDMDDCRTPEDFETFIPGLGPVFHSPVVGYWMDGDLIENGSGYEARKLVGRIFGIGTDFFAPVAQPH